jgi:hypothetical protein
MFAEEMFAEATFAKQMPARQMSAPRLLSRRTLLTSPDRCPASVIRTAVLCHTAYDSVWAT